MIHETLAMALLAFSSIVNDARGSVGGTTFSRNKGGAYARARVAPVNPRSPKQSAVRAAFAANAKQWTGVFTPAERTAWTAFAAANPLVNILGASIIVSGLAMAQKLNQVLTQIGEPTITDPPPDLSVPALPVPTSAGASAGTSLLTIDTAAQSAFDVAEYYIFATPPLAGGKKPGTSAYRFLGNFEPAAAAVTIEIGSNYAAQFGAWNVGASIGLAVSTVNSETGAVTPATIFNLISE